MQLTFIKGSGDMDALRILRADGSEAQIDCPKQGIIPHDMVHFAVEDVLQAHGFIHRVAAGEAAAFRMTAEQESDGVERLVEVFQGDGWSGGTTPPADMLALYATTCEARRCLPLPVTAQEIDAVRVRIAKLTLAWAEVPIGGQLVLELMAQ
jgi:hypothetical protein